MELAKRLEPRLLAGGIVDLGSAGHPVENQGEILAAPDAVGHRRRKVVAFVRLQLGQPVSPLVALRAAHKVGPERVGRKGEQDCRPDVTAVRRSAQRRNHLHRRQPHRPPRERLLGGHHLGDGNVELPDLGGHPVDQRVGFGLARLLAVEHQLGIADHRRVDLHLVEQVLERLGDAQRRDVPAGRGQRVEWRGQVPACSRLLVQFPRPVRITGHEPVGKFDLRRAVARRCQALQPGKRVGRGRAIFLERLQQQELGVRIALGRGLAQPVDPLAPITHHAGAVAQHLPSRRHRRRKSRVGRFAIKARGRDRILRRSAAEKMQVGKPVLGLRRTTIRGLPEQFERGEGVVIAFLDHPQGADEVAADDPLGRAVAIAGKSPQSFERAIGIGRAVAVRLVAGRLFLKPGAFDLRDRVHLRKPKRHHGKVEPRLWHRSGAFQHVAGLVAATGGK